MKLHMLANFEEQVVLMAEHITKLINNLLDKQDMVVIAVSGGKSPIKLFKKLEQATIDWSRITFTLVDERLTNTSSDDSNENLVRTHLLCGNVISAKFIGLMQNDDNINSMIKIANQIIGKIDIAILGMGEDGHTASIFPDCTEVVAALDLTRQPSYIETSPVSAKYQRISLNLSALVRVPYLLLNISGQTKLNVLQEAIRNPSLNYPISYLIKHRPDLVAYWFY